MISPAVVARLSCLQLIYDIEIASWQRWNPQIDPDIVSRPNFRLRPSRSTCFWKKKTRPGRNDFSDQAQNVKDWLNASRERTSYRTAIEALVSVSDSQVALSQFRDLGNAVINVYWS